MPETQAAQTLAVIGAGVMGCGIAALALGSGVRVALLDIDEGKLGQADTKVKRHLKTAQLMSALPAGTVPGELVTTTSASGAADADLVIEAVTELAAVKAAALAAISPVVRPGTPIVSNTSSIPIDELTEAVARPEDFLGTHFMNPPYLIQTVEVIRGRRTGDEALRRLHALLGRLGRTAVTVGDGPGFVTSRVLHPMINDAVRVVEEGTAIPEVVDALFVDCLGHRTGPLRTADLIGLDNLADSLHVLYERTGDAGCAPRPLLLEKIRAGDLGRKSGRGFYDYGGPRS
ncbi:3-hydroxyacyl-CoA dehydrogenase family protein [Kibdelosporangium persicum]|uniref:Methoxymalonate biosynthesis 3-hydroxyacyl-CoA dehydrogenase n=1 Tax=Kibdelosporangium persicum TaxID=2698649 RepID=A0ABX2FJ71_9PSEU|nr:3-hydroxyacyl-CoA dehydrogenase family protein [Kibdelosporangium persicum]NRN71347.1 Methoxymalonate biosynthesis 3-hydroxyacyl-CoA dehydrogenase [Kibdelosporangium persicum]